MPRQARGIGVQLMDVLVRCKRSHHLPEGGGKRFSIEAIDEVRELGGVSPMAVRWGALRRAGLHLVAIVGGSRAAWFTGRMIADAIVARCLNRGGQESPRCALPNGMWTPTWMHWDAYDRLWSDDVVVWHRWVSVPNSRHVVDSGRRTSVPV